MDEIENKKRIELLNTARIILTEEGKTRFAANYKQWIGSNDVSWRVNGVKLPVPVSPSSPTESEIVAKAFELYQAAVVRRAHPTALVSEVAVSVESPTKQIVEPERIKMPESIMPELPVIPEPVVPFPVIIDSALDPVKRIFETPVESTVGFKEMLAGWFQKSQ